jgi:hypothetical protein
MSIAQAQKPTHITTRLEEDTRCALRMSTTTTPTPTLESLRSHQHTSIPHLARRLRCHLPQRLPPSARRSLRPRESTMRFGGRKKDLETRCSKAAFSYTWAKDFVLF